MKENAGFADLNVYKMAYQTAMEIFTKSKEFPKEEKYSLTDQIRRSSRSVCGNIAEGYRKKIYPRSYLSKLADADGECSETMVWIDFAKDCSYINEVEYKYLNEKYHIIGSMLGKMIINLIKEINH